MASTSSSIRKFLLRRARQITTLSSTIRVLRRSKQIRRASMISTLEGSRHLPLLRIKMTSSLTEARQSQRRSLFNKVKISTTLASTTSMQTRTTLLLRRLSLRRTTSLSKSQSLQGRSTKQLLRRVILNLVRYPNVHNRKPLMTSTTRIKGMALAALPSSQLHPLRESSPPETQALSFQMTNCRPTRRSLIMPKRWPPERRPDRS